MHKRHLKGLELFPLGGSMCLLHPNHGSVLGDRGCGVGRHRSSATGSLSIVGCLGF